MLGEETVHSSDDVACELVFDVSAVFCEGIEALHLQSLMALIDFKKHGHGGWSVLLEINEKISSLFNEK